MDVGDRHPDHLLISCSYFREAYDFDAILAKFKREVPQGACDTLVGRGLSGTLVVPRLADALGLAWLIVRKPEDDSHSDEDAEGHIGRKWLFVDDFLSSGNTMRLTISAVSKLTTERKAYSVSSQEYVPSPWPTAFAGVWCYTGERGFMEAEHEWVKAKQITDSEERFLAEDAYRRKVRKEQDAEARAERAAKVTVMPAEPKPVRGVGSAATLPGLAAAQEKASTALIKGDLGGWDADWVADKFRVSLSADAIEKAVSKMTTGTD